MRADTALLGYLRSMVDMRSAHGLRPAGLDYWCMEDYVLQHGRAYSPGRLSPVEHTAVRDDVAAARRAGCRFRQKECFYNAQALVLAGQHVRYVEGYCLAIIPILHGWCETPDGLVIDPTLRPHGHSGLPCYRRRPLIGRTFGEFDDTRAYYGVPMERDQILARWAGGEAGSLIDDWERGWPLLTAAGTARRSHDKEM